MQPPFPMRQLEPYILKEVLLPTQQSSFINNLIISYNKKLRYENEQFEQQFNEKQQKLQRHKQQLNSLPEMKTDPQLMNQILEEIQLKDYEKQYFMILAESQKRSTKLFGRRAQKSIKNNSMDKENNNKTFHITYRTSKKDHSVDNGFKNTQRDQSLFNVTQGKKKFRSSVIKSNSFSAIKRAKTPFSTKTNFNIESIRNSQDVALPQQGLVNYFNLKDYKLSEALYGKRPESKVTGVKREQVSIKRKNLSNLSPEWMKQYAQKQKNNEKRNIVYKNDIKVKFQDVQNAFNSRSTEQLRENEKKKIELRKQERTSFEQQTSSQRRQIKQNQGESKSKRNYHTKMQQMAKSIQQSSRQNNEQNNNPYHISNFIRQLNTYHIASQSTHNLGKINKSKRKLLVEKTGD